MTGSLATIVGDIADRQYGFITRAQCERIGMSDADVAAALAGNDFYVSPGSEQVFAVYDSVVDIFGPWAEYLALDPSRFLWERTDPGDAIHTGVLSHASAAHLHGCLNLDAQMWVSAVQPIHALSGR